MKPTSIIFLIVSVILIIAGAVTCKFASGLAESEEVTLIHPEEEDMKVIYDFSKDQIKTVKLDLQNAEVNVYNNAEKTYIELINFPNGSYEFSSSQPTLSVINDWDEFSISGAASFVSNIDGLCGLINYYNFADSKKVVNIYVSENAAFEGLDCKLDEGVLRLTNWSISKGVNVLIENGEYYINGELWAVYENGVENKSSATDDPFETTGTDESPETTGTDESAESSESTGQDF